MVKLKNKFSYISHIMYKRTSTKNFVYKLWQVQKQI